MAKKLKLGNDLINAVKEIILETSYPVGRIIVSIDNVNPGTYLGGTWVSWGTGRVPVGVDTSQTEFNTVEKTGGEKTHTLNMPELPEIKMYAGSNGDWPLVTSGGLGKQTSCVHCTNVNATQEANVTRSVYTAHRQSESRGQAHNNLQPYITCYMWKRTA